MPARKKPNLSVDSRHAKRYRLMRLNESQSDSDNRLASQRQRTNASRANETPEEYADRLTSQSERQSRSRASETIAERESRLASQSERQSRSRASETSAERESRLASQSERQSRSRASETSAERESRLASQRLTQNITRALETEEDRFIRLTADRERHAEVREVEPESQHETRLEAARERYHDSQLRNEASRSSERQRVAELRQEESPLRRTQRLADDRIRFSLRPFSDSDDLSTAYDETFPHSHEELSTAYDSTRSSRHTQGLADDSDGFSMALFSDNASLSTAYDENISFHDVLSVAYDSTPILPWNNKLLSGFAYDIRINYEEATNVGSMSVVCGHCRALKWSAEANGICCSGGKVKLVPLREPAEPLRSLLIGEHPLAKPFLKSIRGYNGVFQMTSFGAKEIREGNFMPCFKVQGQVCHRIGSLLPVDNADAKFLQLYFIADYQAQADARTAVTPNLDRTIVIELQQLLHENNLYVQQFKSALASIPAGQQENYKVVIKADRVPVGAHRGRFNEPANNEVAVVLVNEECGTRDIVLRTVDDQLQRISETHRSYDTLQYPLIFSFGEDGYHFEIPIFNPATGQVTGKKTSAMQFYAYRIMVREMELNYLLFFQQLLNQYLVDMYAKIEAERLLYIRTHQSRLRADNYIHLQDALNQDGTPENLGRLVILPSSFTGGPRYMHQRTQDAFVYVRKYGRPDLFITITTNPKWDEIKNELYSGQTPQDRHDIITRVFHLKLKKMINLLTKDNIFGAVRCFMFSVEWQKRGLPHAHLLLWLENKIRPNQMDDIICAELPNQDTDPVLFNLIKTHMIHGPCGLINPGSPCMRDGRCSKRYPKRLTPETLTDNNGYPTYRRRSIEDGGHSTVIRFHGQEITIDNAWVVPYSAVLSRALKTHINVEFCGSIEAIKYLCKYVNKGSDQATFVVQNEHDEVLRYQTGRYISTSEAVWRILGLPIHERFPAVFHLDVHLENGQRIYFNSSNLQDRIENPRNTTLTAFFELCLHDNFAKTLLYEQVPSYYTFNKQMGTFLRRVRGAQVDAHPGIRRESTLGRVYTVHPNNAECFYLRLLLTTVRGPTSFADLKTVDGVQYQTYQLACAARNLLDSDQHWDHTLEEAYVGQSAKKLRQLFAIMLVFCNISDPNLLWTKYREHLAEDLWYSVRQIQAEENINEHRPEIENQCLLKLQELVTSMGGNHLNSYGLPTPTPRSAVVSENREYVTETSFDVVELSRIVEENVPKLTNEQKQIYEEVLESTTSNLGKLFFLDAPGGTGKTFLINLLLNKIRSRGHIALAVASSGIAATLLPGGRTAHSCLKIPINMDYTENPVCDISKTSHKASVLRDTVLIVWDECTMAHRKAVEAVDRTLRDIRSNNQAMGGVTFLFSGDFRQTLPVVPKGTRADEVNACLKRSPIWRTVKRCSLRRNMRAMLGGDSQAQQFADTILSIGEGRVPEINGNIDLPPTLCATVQTIDELIFNVYPDIENITTKEDSWFHERAILAPRNDEVLVINNKILGLFEAPSMTYTSINNVMDQNEATNYPTEFLNSLTASGLPVHELQLKIGTPIILMRNLRPPSLCNGTRLCVTRLQQNIIQAVVLTGCGRGDEVLIPRIPLIPSNFPFSFKRLQFPVAACFAMSINKAQGQTLRTVGLNLNTPCFSHGQLYVACSRVSGSRDLFIYAPPNQNTANVVYKEALA